MRKLLAIAKINLAQYLVYRLSFVLWRVRVILSLFLTFFLWSAVYQNRLSIFNYSRSQIMTYILLIYVIGDLVYSSRVADLSNQIRNGAIINQLLKPIPFFHNIFTREITDKLLNLFFSIFEVSLVIFWFKPELFVQTNVLTILLMLLAVFFGVIISFFISFAISLVAFWSAEVWGPRFIFMTLITVLSGSYFPLDILPTFFYRLLLLTPFPYFTYLPTKIYLDGFSFQYLGMVAASCVWAVLAYFFVRVLWRKGIKEFSFFGR